MGKRHTNITKHNSTADFLSIYAFQRKWKPTNSHRHSIVGRSLWIGTKTGNNNKITTTTTVAKTKKNWKHYNHINKLSCESIFVCRRVKHGDRHHLKTYVYLRLAFVSLCACVWNKQMPNFSLRTTQMVLIRLLNWITNVKHGKWEFYYTKTLSRLIRWLGAFYYALFFRWEFHYKFNLRPTQKPHTCLREGVRWIRSYE